MILPNKTLYLFLFIVFHLKHQDYLIRSLLEQIAYSSSLSLFLFFIWLTVVIAQGELFLWLTRRLLLNLIFLSSCRWDYWLTFLNYIFFLNFLYKVWLFLFCLFSGLKHLDWHIWICKVQDLILPSFILYNISYWLIIFPIFFDLLWLVFDTLINWNNNPQTFFLLIIFSPCAGSQ